MYTWISLGLLAFIVYLVCKHMTEKETITCLQCGDVYLFGDFCRNCRWVETSEIREAAALVRLDEAPADLSDNLQPWRQYIESL